MLVSVHREANFIAAGPSSQCDSFSLELKRVGDSL